MRVRLSLATLAAAAATLFAVETLHAQTFDVISVKAQAPGDRAFFVRPPSNGRFMAQGATSKLLLMLAFGITENQIEGGPSWLGTAKWDVEAKMADGSTHTAEETKQMLQNLLVARFGLRFHRDTAPRPVYALSIAKDGSKLKPSSGERTNLHVTGRSIGAQHATITAVTQLLASALGRAVVDRTGLDGFYDLNLEWDDAPSPNGLLGLYAPAGPSSEHGSIFSAIQEQLGLRLDSVRAPIETIVIDHFEMPTAN